MKDKKQKKENANEKNAKKKPGQIFAVPELPDIHGNYIEIARIPIDKNKENK